MSSFGSLGPYDSVPCGSFLRKEHGQRPVPVVFPKHLQPIIVSPYIILNKSNFTLAGSSPPPGLLGSVSIVVVLFRMSSRWNFKKMTSMTRITISKTKAITMTRSET